MLSKEYLAGFFDGEGCISIQLRSNGASLTVSIAQKNVDILLLICQQYPEGKVEQGSFKSQCNYFKLYGKTSKRFLEDIKDIVVCKKIQVRLALEFMDLLKKPSRYNVVTVEEMTRRCDIVKSLRQDKINPSIN